MGPLGPKGAAGPQGAKGDPGTCSAQVSMLCFSIDSIMLHI